MIVLDEPMSKHTTFGVGGPADVFVTPDSVDEAVATDKDSVKRRRVHWTSVMRSRTS